MNQQVAKIVSVYRGTEGFLSAYFKQKNHTDINLCGMLNKFRGNCMGSDIVLPVELKRPRTLDEQVAYLKENKRVVFHKCCVADAKEYLLKYNYINIITPFKHRFGSKGSDGKHVYERDVDFAEYCEKYTKERARYPKLLANILAFERIFNSVFSYYVIHHFNIRSENDFSEMIQALYHSASIYTEEGSPFHKSITKVIANIESLFIQYNKSIYLTLDRLSLGQLLIIYKLLDSNLKTTIIDDLRFHRFVQQMTVKQFEQQMYDVQEIRNCLAHNNSLEIRIRYYNIEKQILRRDTAIKRYKRLLHLIEES